MKLLSPPRVRQRRAGLPLYAPRLDLLTSEANRSAPRTPHTRPTSSSSSFLRHRTPFTLSRSRSDFSRENEPARSTPAGRWPMPSSPDPHVREMIVDLARLGSGVAVFASGVAA